MAEAPERYAVVTGANKGIGLEICKQLASKGVTVILTARDVKKGIKAVENLKKSGLSNVIFHQLDVLDPASIGSLADFFQRKFGKLDVLVNNAGIIGFMTDEDGFRAVLAKMEKRREDLGDTLITETYDMVEACLKTNYYGAKRMCETFIPFLQLSDSPRIVNVSSIKGKLKNIPNEWPKAILSDGENLTDEKVDDVLNTYLKDFKEGSLEAKGWPAVMSAYILSKAAMNAYTRILAKKHPGFCINSVCTGYVKTDINYNTGNLTVEEGAEGPVRVALLPNGGPSGLFFSGLEESEL